MLDASEGTLTDVTYVHLDAGSEHFSRRKPQ